MQKTSALFASLLTLLVAGSITSAAEWGSLKGRFIVDGTPAKPPALLVNKDQFCINAMPKNEAIVVGKDNALVNALVYVRAPLGKKVEVAPEYEAELKKKVTLDNNGCAFHPHITTVRVGQTLVVKNSDPQPVSHNTNLSLLAQNPIIPAKSQTEFAVSKDSPLPTLVNCNIHPWMKGYLVSLAHPYVAVSDNDGKFEIKNIPAGSNEFQFWHEAAGYLKNIKFNGGVADNRGRAKITVKAGETLDLGDIKVPARVLTAQ